MVKKKKFCLCIFSTQNQLGFYNFIKFCFKKSQQRCPYIINELIDYIVKEINHNRGKQKINLYKENDV